MTNEIQRDYDDDDDEDEDEDEDEGEGDGEGDDDEDDDDDDDDDDEDEDEDVRAGAVDIHTVHFTRAFSTGKMRYANPATLVFCEPAQWKCTWTFHKSAFLCGTSQGKCRTLPIPPRANTGPQHLP